MRTAYHEQLDALSGQVGDMCGLAGGAMERATQALLQADLALAEQVITDHEQIAAHERAGRGERVRPPRAAGPGGRRPTGDRQLDPDRRRRRPDGRAGPARRQDRAPPTSAARPARRGQRLLRRNGPRRGRTRPKRPRGADHPRSGEGRPDPRGGRRDGRSAPAPVHRVDGPGVAARRRRRRRRDAARPLLRAVRRSAVEVARRVIFQVTGRNPDETELPLPR